MCVRKWHAALRKSSSYADYLLAVFAILLYTPFVLTYAIRCLKAEVTGDPRRPTSKRWTTTHEIKRKRKVLKTAIAIVLGLAVSWLPFSIISLL